jgi:hypothetical protein
MTGGWVLLFLLGATDLNNLTKSLDPVLILMYLTSVIVYWGAAAALIWASWIAWSTARPLAARIWTVVLALSAIVLLYFALLYHLMSFVTKY